MGQINNDHDRNGCPRASFTYVGSVHYAIDSQMTDSVRYNLKDVNSNAFRGSQNTRSYNASEVQESRDAVVTVF